MLTREARFKHSSGKPATDAPSTPHIGFDLQLSLMMAGTLRSISPRRLQLQHRRSRPSSKRWVIRSIWSCISTLASICCATNASNGLMPRQQLAQPGHLNEADLHNFSDLVPPVAFAVVGAFIEFTDIEARKHPAPDRWPLKMPCRLRMAVLCAIATTVSETPAPRHRTRCDATRRQLPKPTASRSERQ